MATVTQQHPLVSIITPCYNTAPYVAQTIASVRAQGFTDWEMLIVDDASTDQSVSVVKEAISGDARFRLIQLPGNAGPAVARNTGVDAARGRYITFIDSDDLWDAAFLETAVGQMRAGRLFVFGSYRRYDERQGTFIGSFRVPQSVTYRDILRSCPISCLTAMYDAETLGKHYMLDVGREDYTLWLQLLKKVPRAWGIAQPLATYRMRAGSVSRRKAKVARQQWQIYTRVERLGLLPSVFYFLSYVVFGFRKYYGGAARAEDAAGQSRT